MHEAFKDLKDAAVSLTESPVAASWSEKRWYSSSDYPLALSDTVIWLTLTLRA